MAISGLIIGWVWFRVGKMLSRIQHCEIDKQWKDYISNIFGVNAAYMRSKRSRTATYSQHCQGNNMIDTVMHLLASPAQCLCSNPRHQFKGHHVLLKSCACRGSSPVLGHGNSRRNWSIVTAILLRWFQMRALWKTYDPFHYFGWPDADLTCSNAFKMAGPLATFNTSPDSTAPVRLHQILQYCLI